MLEYSFTTVFREDYESGRYSSAHQPAYNQEVRWYNSQIALVIEACYKAKSDYDQLISKIKPLAKEIKLTSREKAEWKRVNDEKYDPYYHKKYKMDYSFKKSIKKKYRYRK